MHHSGVGTMFDFSRFSATTYFRNIATFGHSMVIVYYHKNMGGAFGLCVKTIDNGHVFSVNIQISDINPSC